MHIGFIWENIKVKQNKQTKILMCQFIYNLLKTMKEVLFSGSTGRHVMSVELQD